MKETLKRMVEAARKASRMNEAMVALGYTDTPYFHIGGTIEDAIYYLLGENTATYDESITFQTLSDTDLSDDECVDKLLEAYNNRHDALNIPDRTMNTLNVYAEKRGITTDALIKTILSEWVFRHELISGLMNK